MVTYVVVPVAVRAVTFAVATSDVVPWAGVVAFRSGLAPLATRCPASPSIVSPLTPFTGTSRSTRLSVDMSIRDGARVREAYRSRVFSTRMSPGAGLGDVTRQLYVIVGRGSALYLFMEHRNMPEKNNTIRLSSRALLTN